MARATEVVKKILIDGRAKTNAIKQSLKQIQGDAGKAGKSAKDADKKFNKWAGTLDDVGTRAKAAAKAAGVMGAAAGAAALSVFKFVDSQTQSLDKVAKGARAAGISAESYQRLAFAAERSGVEMDKVAKGSVFLEKVLQDVGRGAGAEAADALQRLGLEAEQFSGATYEERLGIIANALQGVSDEQERSAITMRLLGRTGSEMASLLADGSKGIRDLGDEAQRLGGVMSDEAVAASERFQDELTRLKTQFRGTARELAIQLLPKIQEMLPLLADAAHGAAGFAEGVIDLTQALGSTGTGLVAGLGAVALALGGLPGLFAAAGAAAAAAGSLIANSFFADMTELRKLQAQRDASALSYEEAIDRLNKHRASLSSEEIAALEEQALRAAAATDRLAEATVHLRRIEGWHEATQEQAEHAKAAGISTENLKELMDQTIKTAQEREKMNRLLGLGKGKGGKATGPAQDVGRGIEAGLLGDVDRDLRRQQAEIEDRAREEQLAKIVDFERAKAQITFNERMRAVEEARAAGVDPIALIDEEEQARLSLLQTHLHATEGMAERELLLDEMRQVQHEANMARMREQVDMWGVVVDRTEFAANSIIGSQNQIAGVYSSVEELKRLQMLESGATAEEMARHQEKAQKKAAAAAAFKGGVESLVVGITETVKAAAAFASFNYVQGAMHTVAAALGYAQSGVLFAQAAKIGGMSASTFGGRGGGGFGSGVGVPGGPSANDTSDPEPSELNRDTPTSRGADAPIGPPPGRGGNTVVYDLRGGLFADSEAELGQKLQRVERARRERYGT